MKKVSETKSATQPYEPRETVDEATERAQSSLLQARRSLDEILREVRELRCAAADTDVDGNPLPGAHPELAEEANVRINAHAIALLSRINHAEEAIRRAKSIHYWPIEGGSPGVDAIAEG